MARICRRDADVAEDEQLVRCPTTWRSPARRHVLRVHIFPRYRRFLHLSSLELIGFETGAPCLDDDEETFRKGPAAKASL